MVFVRQCCPLPGCPRKEKSEELKRLLTVSCIYVFEA
jgi:hypothetical protein